MLTFSAFLLSFIFTKYRTAEYQYLGSKRNSVKCEIKNYAGRENIVSRKVENTYLVSALAQQLPGPSSP
jgi:hypothetical protein